MLERRGISTPRCDICGDTHKVEMHEIISRSQTTGSEEMRRLSFDEHLCNLLCPSCHEHANIRSNEAECWFILYKLYGRGDVQKGYEIVKPYYDRIASRITIMTPLLRV